MAYVHIATGSTRRRPGPTRPHSISNRPATSHKFKSRGESQDCCVTAFSDVLCWPKNVVKGCVSGGFDNVIFDHVVLASRVHETLSSPCSPATYFFIIRCTCTFYKSSLNQSSPLDHHHQDAFIVNKRNTPRNWEQQQRDKSGPLSAVAVGRGDYEQHRRCSGSANIADGCEESSVA